MKYISIFITCIALVVVSALAVLNWQILLAATQVNLGNIQLVVPLGLIMLSVAGLLGAIFAWFYVYQHIFAQRETHDLMRELEHARKLATQAEVSRIDDLQRSMMAEFKLLHEKLTTLTPGLVDSLSSPGELPGDHSATDTRTRH
jgi:hypothetical protein